MCGIVAWAGGDPDPLLAERALDRLTHRGPDHGQHWWHPQQRIWLGHRRLSIVDLSPAGNQPLTNEDHTLHLVGNGEIYNAPELRRELETLGHRFRSGSDNEVILHAYEAWGDVAVERLTGMFAFALWDAPRQRLLAARDRLGIKPLYHARLNGGLALASEATALELLLGSARQPDPVALAHILTLGYVPAPLGIWRGVSKLEPGHRLTWEDHRGVEITRYWEPPRELDQHGRTEAVEEVWRERFEGILGQHLLADVPLGLFLSAGLDSSAVAVGLNRLGCTMEAFTVAFPDAQRDEAPLAAKTAAALGFSHTSVPMDGAGFLPGLRTLLAQLDEPQGTSGLPLLHAISAAAAQRYKVVLAGDGGDEVLGGYRWYGDLTPPPGRPALLKRRLLRPLAGRWAPAMIRQAAARQFAWSSPLHRHAWRVFPRFLPEEAAALLAPMGLHYDEEAMLAPLARHFEPRLPLLRALQRVDLMTYCADYNLAKVDRGSMAHALEVRVPFLDHRLVEWALSRPLETLPHHPPKKLLRDYIAPHVPPEVLQRPKQGFSAQNLEATMNWSAAMETIAQGPWVQGGYWTGIWRNLVAPGVPHRHSRIWILFLLTLWGEAHL